MNKYIKEWSEKNSQLKKLLESGKMDEADKLKEEVDMAYMRYRNQWQDTNRYNESKNFGIANYIFEEQLPNLFKNNQNAMKSFVRLVKSDNNLLSEALFYSAINKYDGSDDSKAYVKECLDIASKKIDFNTVNESNEKIAKLMKKYNILSEEELSDEKKKLYEDCNFILTNKKKLSNLTEIASKVNSISDYVKDHKVQLKEEKNVQNLIENFENKYKGMLTEEEMSFVKEITAFKQPIAEERKKKLFDKFKNECIDTVNKLLKEDNGTDKESLLAIKEELLNREYCAESIVTDIAKLLEIRDVLMS